jgi:hypothetical protein
VFSHPALGTPLDPSKLSRQARKNAPRRGVPDSFRPWHGLRHTALTETSAAGGAGNVRSGEGWACARLDDRAVLHANTTSDPEAAELADARLFSSTAND